MAFSVIKGFTHVSPNIVTDGLIFYVDANNPRSYSGVGFNWYDLVGKYTTAVGVSARRLTAYGNILAQQKHLKYLTFTDSTKLESEFYSYNNETVLDDFTIQFWARNKGPLFIYNEPQYFIKFTDPCAGIQNVEVSNIREPLRLNGIYCSNGSTLNGKPVYQRDVEAGSLLINFKSNQWVIENDISGINNFFSNSNTDYPWQATNWFSVEGVGYPSLSGYEPFTNGIFLEPNGGVGISLSGMNPATITGLNSKLLPGEWYMVTVAKSGNDLRIYQDLEFNRYLNVTQNRRLPLYLQKLTLGSAMIELGHIKIYKKALTDLEIFQNFENLKPKYRKSPSKPILVYPKINSSDLALYFSFNDSATARDFGEYNLLWQRTSTQPYPSLVPGKIDGLRGVDLVKSSFLTLTANLWNMDLSPTSFTVATWLKKNALSVVSQDGFAFGSGFGPMGFFLAEFGNQGFALNGYEINKNICYGLQLDTTNRNYNGTLLVHPEGLPIGEWTHVGLVHDYFNNADEGRVQIATVNGGFLHISVDYGQTWNQIAGLGIRQFKSVAMNYDGRYRTIVAEDLGGIALVTDDGGETWSQKSIPGTPQKVAMSTTGKYQIVANSGGNQQLWISRDYGQTWEQPAGSPARAWRSVTVSGNGKTMMAVGGFTNFHFSYDFGETWEVSTALPNSLWRDMCSSYDNRAVAVIDSSAGSKIRKFDIIGSPVTTISFAQVGPTTAYYGIDMCAAGQIYFASTIQGIYRSTNLGSTWTLVYPAQAGEQYGRVTVSGDGEHVVVALTNSSTTAGGLLISNNRGDTWEKRLLAFPQPFSDIEVTKSKRLRLYINGRLVQYANYSGKLGSFVKTWNGFTINGSTRVPGTPEYGNQYSFDDFNIWIRPLNDEEVFFMYNNSFGVQIPDLVTPYPPNLPFPTPTPTPSPSPTPTPTPSPTPTPTDQDALDFIDRVGDEVLCQAGKDQINRFVIAVKNTGLWNNMIAWPVRQCQNAGTNTRVSALGGLMSVTAISGADGILGTLDTPPGMPTWTANGLTFSGIKIDNNNWPQNYMISGPFPFDTACTLYCVINFDWAGLNTDTNNVSPVIMNVRPANTNPFYHFPRRIGLYRTSQTPISLPVNPNSHKYGIGLGQFGPAQQFQYNGPIALDDNNNWAAIGMSYSFGNQLFSRNGSNFTTGNLTQISSYPIVSENFVLMVSTIQRPVDGFRGVGASYFYFNIFLNQQQHTDFYNAYKDSLGQGLPLP